MKSSIKSAALILGAFAASTLGLVWLVDKRKA
jgi:hypothetical protein